MTGLVVVEDHQGSSGAIVWWALKGECRLSLFRSVWENDGLDPRLLPAPPSDLVVLQRALADVKTASQEVRELKKSLAFEIETTWVGDDEASARETVQHAKDARVTLDPDTSRELTDRLAIEVLSPKGQHLEAALLARIPAVVGQLNAVDISGWLVRFAVNLHAVSLRDRGGFYFVPRDLVDEWRQMTQILSSITQHKFFQLPAMDSKEAVDVLLQVVQAEAKEAMVELQTYLAGTPGTRGLNAWEKRLTELKNKVEHYTDLLGRSLPDFATQEQSLRAGISMARLSGGQ